MTLSALPGVSLGQPVSLHQLHQHFGGQLDPAAFDVSIEAIANPEQADSRCLAPLLSARLLKAALGCDAAALLVDMSLAASVPVGRRWLHEHAPYVLAGLLERCAPPAQPASTSPHAIVAATAKLGERVQIAPGAVLFGGCCIGDDCSIGPNAVIYSGVRLGRRVSVGACAVVGRPGFGWATGPGGKVRRMPQLGGVEIEDDVEIGALTSVDSGTLHPTRIGMGCKLDAHVHVGHNVQVGPGTMIAAQSGFAGSAKIGRGVLVGGQVGVGDHVQVGDGARLGAKAGVIGHVPPATTVAGYPAVERMRWLRMVAKALRGAGR